MNTMKYLGFAGLAAAGLFAAQAFATTCPTAPQGGATTQGAPTCVATTSTDPGIPNPSLENLYGPGGSQIASGPGINIYGGQTWPSGTWTITAASGSVNIILQEIAGNANFNSFGIYDTSDYHTTLQLFSGPDSVGARGTLWYNGSGSYTFGANTATFGSGEQFGYYLTTPDGTFYSQPGLNNLPGEAGNPYDDGMHHVVAYLGDGKTNIKTPFRPDGAIFGTNEYILAWEDQVFGSSDLDYNDFILMVESVQPVPEPAALGMFGLGLLAIVVAAGLRRRRSFEA